MLNLITAIDIEEYLNRRDVVIIDLRDKESYENLHLYGAINMSYDRCVTYNGRDFRQKNILIYCDYGHMSLKAGVRLDKKGYNVISVMGGFEGIKAYYNN